MDKIKFNGLSILFSLSVLFSISAQANVRDGLYLGAGIGTVFDQFKLTTRNTINGFTIVSPVQNKKQISGNVFLGYGSTNINKLYLGVEIGSDFPSRSSTISGRPGVSVTAATFTDKLRVQDYVTLDILPGYRFNKNCLMYVRLGGTYAKLSLHQNPVGFIPAFDNEENKIGVRIGAGANFAFNSHFGVGIDYFYTRYPNLTSTYGAFNTQFKQKTSNNYVGISTVYTFK